MRLPLLLVVLIPLAACDHDSQNPSPTAFQVQQLEVALAKDDCIGDLARWERRYQFKIDVNRRSPQYGIVQADVIAFKLRRAEGSDAIQPRRVVLPAKPSLSYEVDDRPGYAAGGQFNTASGKISMGYCSWSKGDS